MGHEFHDDHDDGGNEKACKKCKMFVEGDKCPNCKSEEFTTAWKGRISIINPEKSTIADKIDV